MEELLTLLDLGRGVIDVAQIGIESNPLLSVETYGSKHNDGLYQYPNSDLTDEVFDGAVWVMNIPPAVVTLAQAIEEYNNSDAGKASPFTSESFGGYAYTKATDASGAPIGWKKAFASRLNQWRKL